MMSKAILRFNLYQILKFPSVFFKHPFFSKISKKFFSTNKIVLYFIAIILNIDQGKVKSFYCSSGTLKVFTKDYVYKIGTKNGALKQEYIHSKVIHENFPEIATYLLPVEYSNKFLFRIMKMKRYRVLDEVKNLDYANQILKTFSQYAIKRKCYIAEFPHIAQGLKLAKILYPLIDLESKVEEIFSIPWEIGPVHGDFHMGNILIDENDFPFIVDLDNFSSKGIQALDAFAVWIGYTLSTFNLYCVDCAFSPPSCTKCTLQGLRSFAALPKLKVERVCKTKDTKMTWQDVIRSIMKTQRQDMKSLAFLYILNRLGYENVYYGFLSRSVENEFRLIEEYGISEKYFESV